MFRTECEDRHFWLAVKSIFLGYKFRFDVEDGHGTHAVTGSWAAECGYTMTLDLSGDLVLRASYLACHVENQADSEFHLLVWFVNQDVNGEETSYPLLLTCPLKEPWSPREIVCEENYMEVSVRKPIPPDQEGTEWMNPAPVGAEEGLSEWRVVFHVPVVSQESGETMAMREETVPVGMAHLLGLHINSTGSRVLLRCPYGVRLSYPIQVNGIEMELVSATVLYRHQWTLLRVDTSVACTTRKASLEGTHVMWSFPSVLSPLVQLPVTDREVRVGVEGQYLSSCLAQQWGYQIQEVNGTVEIRVPFGAEGGLLKSHVSNNEYFQSYFLDLFYLHEWKNAQGSLTQQRTFRPVFILRLPRTPRVINSTIVSEGVFSVALGVFPPDVSLVNVTVAGQTVSVSEAGSLGLQLSHIPFPNGTHAYLLQVPFSHPLVSQQYLGDGGRRYSLSVIFSLLVSPEADLYHHPAAVETDLQDVVLPNIEGQCTQRGVELLLHYGNMDTDWAMYMGGQRLDWELVQLAGFSLVAEKDQLSVDVPLYSQGMTYEGLGMEGLLVSAELTLVHPDTGEDITYRQHCVFPVQELLVCLPDGRVVVLIDTSDVFPSIDPKWTSLLNPTCRPLETNESRALFSFSIETCGTIKTLKDGRRSYYNEVRYMPPYQPHLKPPGSHHLNFRVPVECVHPAKGTHTLSIFQSQSNTTPAAARSRRPRLHRMAGHWKWPFLMGQKKQKDIIESGG
ncbi:hypothetical protein AALO_G00028630 [Alosa alosa]|uniref:ZP domain-containing protein n=1 Tax=Alosa alosa TaxID=278164 RepID=A0AAV6HF07_9TELE|nr:uncharacterized protein LOC125291367 [Alosa alosa]KAG5284615.1 hypothetical protein AALO_G00028630 [Alosa alosa]